MDCRKIIDALPKENPSLEDMINACAKVGTGSHNMDMLANTIIAAVKQTPHCYRCGQGHVRANCPQQSTPQGTFQGQRGVNANCNRCGRVGHVTKECGSRFHVNGQFFKDQGNKRPSVTGKRMMTQAFSHPPVQACVTSSQPGQEG